jgi:hypothetical protein
MRDGAMTTREQFHSAIDGMSEEELEELDGLVTRLLAAKSQQLGIMQKLKGVQKDAPVNLAANLELDLIRGNMGEAIASQQGDEPTDGKKHLLTMFHCVLAAALTILGFGWVMAGEHGHPIQARLTALGAMVLFALITTRVSWRAGYEAGRHSQIPGGSGA